MLYPITAQSHTHHLSRFLAVSICPSIKAVPIHHQMFYVPKTFSEKEKIASYRIPDIKELI